MMKPDACIDNVIIQTEQLDPEMEPNYQELIRMPME